MLHTAMAGTVFLKYFHTRLLDFILCMPGLSPSSGTSPFPSREGWCLRRCPHILEVFPPLVLTSAKHTLQVAPSWPSLGSLKCCHTWLLFPRLPLLLSSSPDPLD